MDSIIKVLEGKRVGTLFHRDAHLWVKQVGARELAVAARESSRRLQVILEALYQDPFFSILSDFCLCFIKTLNYLDWQSLSIYINYLDCRLYNLKIGGKFCST